MLIKRVLLLLISIFSFKVLASNEFYFRIDKYQKITVPKGASYFISNDKVEVKESSKSYNLDFSRAWFGEKTILVIFDENGNFKKYIYEIIRRSLKRVNNIGNYTSIQYRGNYIFQKNGQNNYVKTIFHNITAQSLLGDLKLNYRRFERADRNNQSFEEFGLKYKKLKIFQKQETGYQQDGLLFSGNPLKITRGVSYDNFFYHNNSLIRRNLESQALGYNGENFKLMYSDSELNLKNLGGVFNYSSSKHGLLLMGQIQDYESSLVYRGNTQANINPYQYNYGYFINYTYKIGKSYKSFNLKSIFFRRSETLGSFFTDLGNINPAFINQAYGLNYSYDITQETQLNMVHAIQDNIFQDVFMRQYINRLRLTYKRFNLNNNYIITEEVNQFNEKNIRKNINLNLSYADDSFGISTIFNNDITTNNNVIQILPFYNLDLFNYNTRIFYSLRKDRFGVNDQAQIQMIKDSLNTNYSLMYTKNNLISKGNSRDELTFNFNKKINSIGTQLGFSSRVSRNEFNEDYFLGINITQTILNVKNDQLINYFKNNKELNLQFYYDLNLNHKYDDGDILAINEVVMVNNFNNKKKLITNNNGMIKMDSLDDIAINIFIKDKYLTNNQFKPNEGEKYMVGIQKLKEISLKVFNKVNNDYYQKAYGSIICDSGYQKEYSSYNNFHVITIPEETKCKLIYDLNKSGVYSKEYYPNPEIELNEQKEYNINIHAEKTFYLYFYKDVNNNNSFDIFDDKIIKNKKFMINNKKYKSDREGMIKVDYYSINDAQYLIIDDQKTFQKSIKIPDESSFIENIYIKIP